MAGDTINIYGKSYYNLNGGTISGNTTAPTTLALLTSFAGTKAMSSKGVSGTALNSITQLTSGITSLLGTQPAQTSNTPKAFINWILFDERFNYAGGGYDRVGSSGTVKNHNSSTIPSIVVPKNGYIYVCCSNESNLNVFFDNLQIIHSRGPIVEETHYYPFGLTMAAVSSKSVSFGAPTNRLKYNGKEEQRQEFSDGAGLEWLDFQARNYDFQIGRWLILDPLASKVPSSSPFNYAYNNPLLFIDPDGKFGDYYDGRGVYLGNDGLVDGKVYVLNANFQVNRRANSPEWGGLLDKKVADVLKEYSEVANLPGKIYYSIDKNVDPSQAVYNKYDKEIAVATVVFNRGIRSGQLSIGKGYKLGVQASEIDVNLVKALAYKESRLGHGKKNSTDPSDILSMFNPGDFGDKWKMGMTMEDVQEGGGPTISLMWGLKWLYFKSFRSEDKITKNFQGWEYGILKYGPGEREPDYVKTIMSIYLSIK